MRRLIKSWQNLLKIHFCLEFIKYQSLSKLKRRIRLILKFKINIFIYLFPIIYYQIKTFKFKNIKALIFNLSMALSLKWSTI